MRGLGLAIVAGAMSCRSAQPRPPSPPDALASEVVRTTLRMHARYDIAMWIEDAVARADLARARGLARDADIDEPDAVPRWRPYLQAVRDATHEVERSDDLVTAARATSELARACARCHEAIGAHVMFDTQPPPSMDSSLATEMSAHAWAATQMWEGLVGPADDRWTAGATLLAKAPIPSQASGDDVDWMRSYASHAATLVDQDRRAQLFGQILTTCAHCHAELRER